MKCYLITSGGRDDTEFQHVFSTLDKAHVFLFELISKLTKYPWVITNWTDGCWHYGQNTDPDPYYKWEGEFDIWELDYD